MYCKITDDVLNVSTGDSSPPPTLDHKRPQPKGFVRLKINERAARIAMWLNQNFLVQDGEVAADENANLPKVSFLCLRNRPNELHIQMDSNGNMEFISDDMDLCGDVIQALAEYLGLEDLPATCDF